MSQTNTATTTTATTTTTTTTAAGRTTTKTTHTPPQSSAPAAPASTARMTDQAELGHSYGEDRDQHLGHSTTTPVHHWGLSNSAEEILFYAWAIPSWCFNIVAGVLGSYYSTANHVFIICAALFQFLSWAAWWQTAVQMIQRASWVRDEGNLVDRRRFLHLAVRLQRLMLPTAVISFCVFVVAYVRRNDTGDLANWLLFQIVFIFNTVGCVMNAYNNITWESDRLEYEEGSSPYGNILLAIIGIPTKPRMKEKAFNE